MTVLLMLLLVLLLLLLLLFIGIAGLNVWHGAE
jgi:hypothetical protein